MLQDLLQRANENQWALKENPYPGRGIVVGIDDRQEYAIQAYFVMGRSENSRNRILVDDGDGTVRTEAADPTKVEDPSLIIYTAMSARNRVYAVSNGHQTTDFLECYDEVNGCGRVYRKWDHEPDGPNFTPRITAITSFIGGKMSIEMSVIKRSPFGFGSERQIFRYDDFELGFGLCVTTYKEDGNPLPSFEGTPYLLQLVGTPEQIAHNLWNTINAENRVALVVKGIHLKSHQQEITIINALTPVTA